MAQLTIKNVSKIAVQGGGAVHDFNLEVSDREFVVLAGPEGCGNSALLRLIAGLDTPSSGEIMIGNRPVNTLAPKDRDVAMVFAHSALYPHLSASKNIAFGLKGRHFPKTEVDKRVREAAEIAGAAETLERKPTSLTAVEQLRVALARALVRQPKLILCDNPLAALSGNERAGMRAELVKLQERLQTTLIFATQDPLEAMTLGHRVAVMREGRLEQFDTPLAVYNQPANLFTAGFLGLPKINLIAGRLRTTQEELFFKETEGTVEVKLSPRPEWKAFAGKDVVLGIRAEDIRPVQAANVKGRDVRCQGLVDHVEATGAETYYYVQTGGHTVVLRSDTGGEPASAGRRMSFDIDPEKVHLFDVETAARLS